MGGGVSASGELGLNERAWQIADAMAKNAAALRVAVRQLSGGARVIDAGIDATGGFGAGRALAERSEEHTSELQSRVDLVCRLLLEKKKKSNRQKLQ